MTQYQAPYTVFIVEDNPAMRDGILQVVQRMGLRVSACDRAETALEQITKNAPEILITDYRLPGMDGLAFLQAARQKLPEAAIIFITAYGSIELAVQAMQNGAADFITKPFSMDELTVKLDKIIKQLQQRRELEQLQEQNLYLREQVESQFNFGEIIGQAPPMQEVFRLLQKVAPTDSSVIIYGESGTGKELVARAIHKNSRRSNGPFIRVHCGALAETLLESELFGHEKGAFTGALKRKQGRFELAHGGTIFLDEIGDISPAMQVRLLRVLQEREFERVGGEETVHVDTRVIAATHRDLKSEVEAGRFREDLYYRLYILPIHLPPLRQRSSDVGLLIQHFLKKMAAELGKAAIRIQDDAHRLLLGYHWPGNIRELENIIERAAVLCDQETITVNDLPPLAKDRAAIFALPEDQWDLNKTLEEVERALIERAMKKSHGVKAEAARLLGIKTTTLLYKLSKNQDASSPEDGN
ncbi:MAG: sigma-54-dependent transcriptional regulator [bacterium]